MSFVTRRRLLVLFVLSAALFAFAYWNQSKGGGSFLEFPFDDSLAWEDQYQVAKERGNRYCEQVYPRINPSVGATAKVDIRFLQKQFPIVVYNDPTPGTESYNIREYKYWEADITARAMNMLLALRKMITDKFVFVDHGAGVGWYSLVAASLDIPVIAIEAGSKDCTLIRHNLCANSFHTKVTLFETGLPMPTLDQLFSFVPELNIGVMKMDVDNRRPFFLSGDHFFRNFPPLFLLLKVATLNSHQLRFDFVAALTDYGYRLYDRTCVKEVPTATFYIVDGSALTHICLVHKNLELTYNLSIPGP